MMRNQNLPTGAKFVAWYLIIFFVAMLIWEMIGRVWNMLLFERTRMMMCADASVGTLFFCSLCFASAIAFLKVKRTVFFAVLLINGILIAGYLLALVDMAAKAEWDYSWPYATWASIFLILSFLSVILVLRKATRKIFFTGGGD